MALIEDRVPREEIVGNTDTLTGNTESGPNIDVVPREAVISPAELEEKPALISVYENTIDADPDTTARVLKYSNKLNEDPSYVLNNLPEFDKAFSGPSKEELASLENNYPKISKWLYRPENMVVAKDDLENMSWLERAVTDVSQGWKQGRMMRDLVTLRDEQLADTLKTGKLGNKWDSEIEKVKVASDTLQYNRRNVDNGILYEFSQQVPNMLGSMYKGMTRAGQAGAVLAPAAVALAPETMGLSLPVAAATAMKVGYWVGSGEDAARVERALAFDEYVTAKGNNGEKIDPVKAANMASAVGAINGSLETLGDLILFDTLGKPILSATSKVLGKIPQAEKFLKFMERKPEVFKGLSMVGAVRKAGLMMLKAEVSEISTEVGQEITTATAGEVLNRSRGGFDDVGLSEILNRSSEVIGPTFKATLIPSLFGAGVSITNDVHAIRKANQAKDFYSALGEKSEESKVKQRLPEAHKTLVENITKDTPVQDIYIPVEAFDTYFQTLSIPIEDVVKELGVDKQYVEAKERGDNVKIPLSTWTDKVVGTEHYKGLSDDIKFGPDDLTVREAKQVETETKAQFDKVTENANKEAETLIKDNEEIRVKRDTLQEQFFKELEGKRPKTEAQQLAAIMANMVITEANKRGITAEQYIADSKFPTVQKVGSIREGQEVRPYDTERVKGMTYELKDVKSYSGGLVREDWVVAGDYNRPNEGAVIDRYAGGTVAPEWYLNAGYTESDMPRIKKILEKYLNGEILTEDQANVLDDIYNKSIDSEKDRVRFKIKSYVEKNISDDYGLDTWLNPSDEELNKIFKEADINIPATRDDYMNALHEVAYERGELNNYPQLVRDNGEVAYFQNAPAVESKAFKKWFGDSKVVDSEGKPLVVYHGTNSEISVFDIEKAGQSSTAAGVGFWFSPIKEFGKNFIKDIWYGDSKPTNYEVYLSIKNPKVYESSNVDEGKIKSLRESLIKIDNEIAEFNYSFGWNAYVKGEITVDKYRFFSEGKTSETITSEDIELKKERDSLIKERDQQREELDKELFSDAYEKFKTDLYKQEGKTARDANVGGLGMALDNRKETIAKFREKLKNDGFDGIIIKNTIFDKTFAGQVNDQYVALYPEQIKSVNNRGTFDPNNPNIMYQSGNPYGSEFDINLRRNGIEEGSGVIKGERLVKGVTLSQSMTDKIRNFDYRVEPLNISELKAAPDTVKDGPLVVNTNNEVLSGYDKVQEAIKNGNADKTITAYKAIDKNTLMQEKKVKMGMIQFLDDKTLITLTNASNATTFIHELGHFYLKDMKAYVETGKASEQYIKDWSEVKSWLNITDDQKELTVEQQEKFADGLVKYVGEGKAPSENLRRAFESFKKWILKAYKTLTGDNVELNDNIRAVFDRMLATEEEINEIRENNKYRAVVSDNVTENEQMASLEDKAYAEAFKTLFNEQMQELKDDHKQFLAGKRKEALERAIDEANNNTVYPLMKEVSQSFDDKDAKEVALSYKNKEMTDEQKDTFDLIAELNEYGTGGELAEQILNTPTKEQFIKDSIEAEMAQYKDLKDTNKIKKVAYNSVLNKYQAELIALQSEILDRQGRKQPGMVGLAKARFTAELARNKAQEILGDKKIGEATDATPFLRAEVESAKKAAKFLESGNQEKAREYKYKQLLNHELARLAFKNQEIQDKALKSIDKILKKRLELFKDQKTFDQVAYLLDRFGFGRHRDYMPGLKDQSLLMWGQEIDSALGNEGNNQGSGILNIAGWILEEQKSPNYKTMTIEQLTDVKDALTNILHAANVQNKSFILQKNMEIKSIVESLVTSAGKSIKDTKKELIEDSKFDEGKKNIEGIYLSLKKMDTKLHRIDGNKDNGLWNKLFRESQKLCADNEFRMSMEYVEKYMALWNKYSRDERREIYKRKLYIPEFGADKSNPITKRKLIAMALNLGNDLNRTKLMNNKPFGFRPTFDWTEENAFNVEREVMAVLERELTEKDWDFVQGVWDMLEDLKSPAFDLHEDMTGFRPKEVEAVPFEVRTASGTKIMRGGYFPLVADTRLNEKANVRDILDTPLYAELNPAFKQVTKTGHLKARTSAQYSVALDLTIVNRHITDVIHDINFRPLVYDLRRVIKSSEFMNFVKSRMGVASYRMFDDYVSTIATGGQADKMAYDKLSRLMRATRLNFAVAQLAARTGVVVQNISNLFAAKGLVEGFGSKDIARAMLFRAIPNGISSLTHWKTFSNQKQFVFDKSAFMLEKHSNPEFTLSGLHQSKIVPTLMGDVREFALRSMSYTDELINIPIWLEAYNKKKLSGATERESVAYADTLIERLSTSPRKYDQAQMLRGNELEKLFTIFHGFMNNEFNNWLRQLDMVRDGNRVLPKIKNTPEFLSFVFSRILFSYASAALSGQLFRLFDDGDDDDDIKKIVSIPLSYGFGMTPIVKDVANVMIDEWSGGYSFGYRMSPVQSVVENFLKAEKKTRRYVSGNGEGQDVIEAWSKVASVGVPGFTEAYPDQFNVWFFNAYDYLANDMTPQFRDIYKRRPKRKRNED